ncbi:hypothetical protein [Chitinilyticum litopenaei]|uniref:hypothetical protein n=1 Tax=Chitinilyticum litopenaei TaxID=1121276 RepID=UPI0003FC0665|nr:hypothetical protein [Chitinilyticum litopenaei]
MVIDSELAHRFIDAYMAFLATLLSEDEKKGKRTAQWLVIGRARFGADRATLAAYRDANPDADMDMLDAIASLRFGRWVYLKDTRAYSVLLPLDCDAALGVLGLTERLSEMAGGYSGVVFRTGVMALGGRWVCDGLVEERAMLGGNYRKQYAERYTALRAAGAFTLGPER